jgi:hypothetical protein
MKLAAVVLAGLVAPGPIGCGEIVIIGGVEPGDSGPASPAPGAAEGGPTLDASIDASAQPPPDANSFGDDRTLGDDQDDGTPDASPEVDSGQGSPPSCASSCLGCCDTSGFCQPGQADDTACGVGGAGCVDCTASDRICVNAGCRVAPSIPGDGGLPCAPCPPCAMGGACCKADQSCGCSFPVALCI